MKRIHFILFTLLFISFCFRVTTAAIQDNLVAYYPFNGNANDESGNNNHGTVYGATLTEDRFGQQNRAYFFDGINDYIDIDNPAAFDNMDSFTITGWFFLKTYENRTSVIISKVTPQRDFVVEIWNNGYLNVHFAHLPATYFHCRSYEAMPLNQWLFFGAVWNGEEWTLYLDGSIIDEKNFAGYEPPWTGNYMAMGRRANGGENYNGKIDEIRIYDCALSNAEINNVMMLPEFVESEPNNEYGNPEIITIISNNTYKGEVYKPGDFSDLWYISEGASGMLNIENTSENNVWIAVSSFSNNYGGPGNMIKHVVRLKPGNNKDVALQPDRYFVINVSVPFWGNSGGEYCFDISGDWNVSSFAKSLDESKQELTTPNEFSLKQNYPNPFNPSTTIGYQLKETNQVTLSIFNLLGEEVRQLINGIRDFGQHSITWDGKDDLGMDVVCGVYIYKITSGSYSAVQKMTLIR